MYLFPIAGALTSLSNTTPAEREQKGWKPIAILTSFVLPINLLRMIKFNPTTKTLPFASYIGLSCFVTGAQWCAGRQFGHIVGRFLDKY